MIEFKLFDRAKPNHRVVIKPLVAFEAIRRILDHAIYVERADLEQLLGKSWAATVLGYAAKLRSRKDELFDEQRPDPVLPVVDAANLALSHTTCYGGTALEVSRWHRSDRVWLTIRRPRRPLNLNSGRDLAIALLGMAAVPNENWAAPDFWEQARNVPGENAVFDAFLALRKAGFTNDEVIALMAPAGLVPDPDAIGLTVLGWDTVDEFDRRMWLYRHAALFGDTRDWIPLPAAPRPTQIEQPVSRATLPNEPLADWERELQQNQ